MFKYLVLLGVAVQFVGITAYIKEVIKGNNKPNKVTWLLWSIAPLIASAAAISAGVTWAVLPVFMSGFGPLLVLIVSFASPKSYWKLESFDYLCGLFSLLALVLWLVTKDPVIAIMFAVASDGFAAIPTLIKSWQFPNTETASPFAAGLFSAVTSFFVIPSWTPAQYLFPVYLVAVNSALILTISIGKILKNKSK
jgi:hypothetical protein